MKSISLSLLTLAIPLLFSCKTTSKTTTENTTPTLSKTSDKSLQSNVLIYKTKGDYKNLVPIKLSDDKTEIIAYPSPSDLKKDGKFSSPIELKNGYLLDQKGISKNTVFISLTYEEYSKLSHTILLSEMYKLIVDKEPFTEMYDCGSMTNFKDVVQELNYKITKGELTKTFERII